MAKEVKNTSNKGEMKKSTVNKKENKAKMDPKEAKREKIFNIVGISFLAVLLLSVGIFVGFKVHDGIKEMGYEEQIEGLQGFWLSEDRETFLRVTPEVLFVEHRDLENKMVYLMTQGYYTVDKERNVILYDKEENKVVKRIEIPFHVKKDRLVITLNNEEICFNRAEKIEPL